MKANAEFLPKDMKKHFFSFVLILLLLLKNIYFIFICVYAWVQYVHMCAGPCRG